MQHWSEAAKAMMAHVVKIDTPTKSGTGFFIGNSGGGNLIGIATAAHVLDHAHLWEQPVRVTHAVSGRSVFLKPADRAVLANWERDTAALVFPKKDLGLEASPVDLIAPDKYVPVGSEIAWLGYPGVSRDGPCFFSGRVSFYSVGLERYLVDGVAIQGVSGGPAFNMSNGALTLIGVVSAYIPNRLTGESLPGLSVVVDVSSLKSQIASIRSFGAAKSQETQQTQAVSASPPADVLPPSGAGKPNSGTTKGRRASSPAKRKK
ncbi:MAG: serine protease [Candidatus Eisenbacteria bacterium]